MRGTKKKANKTYKQNKDTVGRVKELKGYNSLRQAAQKLGMSKEGVRWYIKNTNKLTPIYRVDDFYLIPDETIENFKNTRVKKDNPK